MAFELEYEFEDEAALESAAVARSRSGNCTWGVCIARALAARTRTRESQLEVGPPKMNPSTLRNRYSAATKPSKQNGMVLAFRIPEGPYTDAGFARLHKGLEVTEAVATTLEMFAPALAELLGAAVFGPAAGLVALLMSLGSGYAEAEAIVAKKNLRTGFAMGVVIGADGRTWPYAKDMFWHKTPDSNAFYPHAGVVGQRSHNLGLAAGFVQGRNLTVGQKTFFWQSIGRALTDLDRYEFGGQVSGWPKSLWVNWYMTAAVKFLKLYAKD